MTAQLFQDQDHEYAAWLLAHPSGYVLNIERSRHPSEARLHVATCSTLTGLIQVWRQGQKRLTSQWVKVCARSVDELDEWMAAHGHEPAPRCPLCAPPGPSAGYRVRASSREVTMAAPRYLPFERLSPAQTQARDRLRRALARLSATGGELLSASYSGPKPRNSDVENLVFYNVDSSGGSMVAASAFGVRFELDGGRSSSGSGCEYRYRLVNAGETLASWSRGRQLARFAGAELGAFRDDHRLARVWLGVHQARDKTCAQHAELEGWFGVFLELEVPSTAPPGLRPDLLKVLMDGVVCAFQSQSDEETLDGAASRVAEDLDADPTVVGALLRGDGAVLGSRPRLVYFRSTGVQWNPSDHRCVAGEVLRRPSDRWRLRGEIYELHPARTAAPTVVARVGSLLDQLRRG